MTGDRDSLQLVTDDVTVLYPTKGVSDLTRFTPEAVEEKYGLTPAQYPDFAALRGDPSDNLPGIPGVGEKTAAKWIREFGRSAVSSTGSTRSRARPATHCARTCRTCCSTGSSPRWCATWRCRTPRTSSRWRRGTATASTVLFDDLEFRVLRDRLFDTLASADARGRGGLRGARRDRSSPVRVARLARRRTPSTGERHGRVGGRHRDAVRRRRHRDRDRRRRRRRRLRRDRRADTRGRAAPRPRGSPTRPPKALHEAKWAMHALRGRGWTLAGLTSDTALAAYLVRPGQRTLQPRRPVAAVPASASCGPRTTGDGQLSLLDDADQVDAEAAESADARARAVLDLAAALDTELADIESAALLVRDGAAAARGAGRHRGAPASPSTATTCTTCRAGSRPTSPPAANAAYEVIGKQINLGSPKQLQVVLFDELDMPKTKKTKTGYTTDADALQACSTRPTHPFLEHLLAHRDATELRVTVDGLLKTVADDGRIHTTFNQTVAATGRLSSTEPNLQNIPVRTDAGRQIRDGFVVGEGFDIAADRRLQPDRDADHGAPLRGRGPDRGVQHRRGPAHASSPRRRSGCRSRRSRRRCAAGSRRCRTGWRTG